MSNEGILGPFCKRKKMTPDVFKGSREEGMFLGVGGAQDGSYSHSRFLNPSQAGDNG